MYVYCLPKEEPRMCHLIQTWLAWLDWKFMIDVLVCFSACMESYRKGDELDACCLGCDSQVPFAIEEHSKVWYEIFYIS